MIMQNMISSVRVLCKTWSGFGRRDETAIIWTRVSLRYNILSLIESFWIRRKRKESYYQIRVRRERLWERGKRQCRSAGAVWDTNTCTILYSRSCQLSAYKGRNAWIIQIRGRIGHFSLGCWESDRGALWPGKQWRTQQDCYKSRIVDKCDKQYSAFISRGASLSWPTDVSGKKLLQRHSTSQWNRWWNPCSSLVEWERRFRVPGSVLQRRQMHVYSFRNMSD